MLNRLYAISPIDGRYSDKTSSLNHYASEAALIKYRLMIEVEWLIFLSEQSDIIELAEFTAQQKDYLRKIVDEYTIEDAEAVKIIEKTTRHDVKAVEYFLKEKLTAHPEYLPALEFVHFACTSEDINNIAYALMLSEIRHHILAPLLRQLRIMLAHFSHQYADLPMLARTHGQAATPTTVGKEFANVCARLERQLNSFNGVTISAKINGATGNFNAHITAYPNIDWLAVSKNFIEQLNLHHNAYTTQIEPHDYIAEYSHVLMRINTILIDFSRDIWGYIALDYFKQIKEPGQIGSSTMPHKINPIDFENAEGNLGLANALLGFFAEKLPISRFQRDLSDSTVLRNIGVAVAHGLLGYHSLEAGLKKISVNSEKINHDLAQHWEVLAEPIQTILRKYAVKNSYEQLLNFSQGKPVTQENLSAFIRTLDLPEDVKDELIKLTPASYIGLAEILAKKI